MARNEDVEKISNRLRGIDEETEQTRTRRQYLRSFEDPAELGRLMRDRAVQGIRRNFEEPVEITDIRTNNTFAFEMIGDIEAGEPPDPYDYAGIYKTMMRNGTWSVPVKARFRIVEKDGDGNVIKVHDENKKPVTIAKIPMPTYDRGFLVKGKKRHLANQFRRRPGVFTLRDGKGAVVTEFNVDPQSDSDVKNFRFWLDDSGTGGPEFRMHYGTAEKIPAWDVAKLMGATERDLRKSVDKETAEALISTASDRRYDRTVRQLHRSITADAERSRDPDVPLEALEREVREQLETTKFDPHIMGLTMGSRDEQLNKELVLKSFRKMQRVANEEIDPDDRESLSLKRVMAPYDLVAESVGRDNEVKKFRGMLQSNLRSARAAARDTKNPDRKPRITQVLGNKLNPKIESKLTTSMLQRSDTSTNPLLWWADSSLTTVMGEGGIRSGYGVPLDAKLINGSHVGFLDLVFTPESDKSGVNLHVAGKSRIVPDDRPDPSGPETGASKIVSPFLQRDGTEIELSPDELQGKTVALWDQYKRKKDGSVKFKSDVVRATRNGEPVEVKASEVDLVMPDFMNAFNSSAALIPFANSAQGNRIQYAAKQTQAGVPLANREEPLVQVKLPGSDLTLEDVLGEEAGAVRARFDGTVEDVVEGGPGERYLVLRPNKSRETVRIPLPKDIPMGGHTPFDARPVVQKGQKFKRGDVLADSTFTKNGKLALGTNLRVAYMPWQSDTHEDAVMISERAAQKMTSEHLYHVANQSKRQRIGKKAYDDVAGPPLSREELDALDSLGIVKPGTKLKPGQTMMVGARNVAMDDEQLQAAIANLGVFGKKKTDLFKSKRATQLTWNEPYEGEVVDVEPIYAGSKRKGNLIGANITVRTAEPMQAGDKLFGRHGNKGVVSRVVTQDQMPRIKGKVEITAADGPFVVGQEITEEEFKEAKKKHRGLKSVPATIDLVLNPLGVPSRMNPSQNHETDLGRVAKQRGEIQKVEAFAYDDNWEEVGKRMKEVGLPDREVIVDPSTGQEIPDIGVGHQYILKAKQQVTKKNAARGVGQFRDNDLASRSGGGARSLGELGVYGLLAQDAREFLRNAQLYSSEDRPEIWSAIRSGQPLGDLGVSVDDEAKAFKRFKNYLRAAGVEPEHLKEKSTYRMRPLTDDDVVRMSNIGVGPGQRRSAVIEDPTQTFDAKSGKARSGGLFDKEITYGNGSPYWTRFELEQRMPNPVYEKSIQDLLGIDSDRFHNILKGKEAVEIGGSSYHGSRAIEQMLRTVNLDREYETAFETARSSTVPSQRSTAYRKLRSIQMLREQKLEPVNAFMRKQVAVVPQQLREYRVDPDGEAVVGDLNVLYRDIGMTNEALREARKQGIPPKALGHIEHGLYETLRTLQQSQGSKPLSGDYQGIMGKLVGEQPGGAGNVKSSLFKSEVFQRRQAFSGGAVLAADDRLGIDEVGVPKTVFAGIAGDHILGSWRRRHPDATPEDIQAFKDRLEKVQKRDIHDAEIDEIMREVSKSRDLIVKRDPVLHKYGIQSFKPVLTEQKSLGLNPLVFGGFNADSVIGDIWLRDNDVLQTIDISEFPRQELLRERDGVRIYSVPNGLEVPTLIDGRVQYAAVTEFSIHPDCEEWEVELSDGQIIQMAATHSVAASSLESCEVEKIDACDSIGRWVPTVRYLRTEGKGSWPDPETPQGRARPAAPRLCFRHGWWVGALAGDGWVDSKDYTNLAFGEYGREVADHWEEVSQEICPGAAVNEEEMPHSFDGVDCVSLRKTLSSVVVGRWARGLVGTGSYNKHLPKGFIELPFEVRAGMFCGLLDTDGCISLSKKGQYVVTYATQSLQLAEDVETLARTLEIDATVSETFRKGRPEYTVVFCFRDIWRASWIELQHLDKQDRLDAIQELPEPKFDQKDRVPLPSRVKDALLSGLRAAGATKKKDRNKAAFSSYVVVSRSEESIPRQQIELLQQRIELTPLVQEWLDYVEDLSIRWERVVRAEPTGRCIEMYDIKVPGPYTFAMASGAIVWDSDGDVMGIFMPITEEAQQEAKTKLRPTANLFNPSNGGLEYTLGHESVLGIAKATRDPRRKLQRDFASVAKAEKAWRKGEIRLDDEVTIGGKRTTTGRAMFSSNLPSGVNFETLREGGEIQGDELPVGVSKRGGNLPRTLEYLARNHTESYGETANRLRQFGQDIATYSGSSLIREDLKPQFKKERRELETSLSDAIRAIQSNRKISPAERRQQIGSVFASQIRKFNAKQEELWDSQLKQERPASLVELVKSGARAKENQLKQTLVAPIAVVDGQNNVVQTPVLRNYSEGMDAKSFIATAHGARMGAVSKVLQVRDPGYLTKQIVNTAIDQVVTEADCGTSDGVSINVNNRDAIRDLRGRVLTSRVIAGKHRFGAGHVLGARDISSIQRQLGDNSEPLFVKVRSATRCKAASGVCQKCAGYDPSGQPFKIGTNLGVIASQALGERSTQLTLSTFHGGGVFDPNATSAANLYNRAEALFRMPSTMGGERAVVATEDAVVKNVKENRAKGGWDIITEGKKPNFFVPKRFTAPWEAGTSDGDAKSIPDFYKPGTRIGAGDVLSSGVANPKDILKATGDIGRVQDYLTDRIHGLFKSEGILRSNVEVVVKSMTDTVEIDNPGGSALLPGQRVSMQQAERARRDFPDLTYRPILRGVDVAPREKREDFMSRLNFNNLRRTIQESAQIGAESNYHSHNPIPGLAVGRFFNRPAPGQTQTGAY